MSNPVATSLGAPTAVATGAPLRFTVCTYNIWTDTRWPQRQEALEYFARVQRPDVWCVQELQPFSKATIDDALSSTHSRVHDDFPGWSNEGNIYWNHHLFELVDYGIADVGIIETLRRFFWVRLRTIHDPTCTVLFSTAHFTYSGHPQLVASELNARIGQARLSLHALDGIATAAAPGEPQFFMGDFNDTNEPIKLLRDGGFSDCFSALGRSARATYPALPTSHGPEQTIDWLMHRGPVRCMTAEVIDFYLGDIAPSDHKAIVATYGFEPAVAFEVGAAVDPASDADISPQEQG
jgi:endonuclease/exonuclease/phosphatase family metal-dependent hydrolase